MLKGYKTEINSSFEQRQIINQTIGTCRWIFNKFIEVNQDFYEKGKTYKSGYAFSKWLKIKCQDYNIELRQVDRFYPSSQICSDCAHNQSMPLNKRTYHCHHCGMIKDRDMNASINLKQATEYTVIV